MITHLQSVIYKFIQRILYLLIILFFCSSTAWIHMGGDDSNHISQDIKYPVPAHTEKLLFYLQRTLNRNTVIYELDVHADGSINKKEPVHPSWIVFEEGGIRKELTFIQTRVYGISVRPLENNSFLIHFRAYKKKDIYLVRTGKNNSYKALTTINGKMAELTSLFISTENNALGIPSVVKYIDVSGLDPVTGNVVKERVMR